MKLYRAVGLGTLNRIRGQSVSASFAVGTDAEVNLSATNHYHQMPIGPRDLQSTERCLRLLADMGPLA